ncbi:MAG: 2-oxoacid:acceptor oxidoreductase family protein [Verrucomicrobia bacterium]|nr:2-oxoacid:acceptor oxidoreductase family protein [Verrucomicrobiota bacterium]MCG2680151.1 2-oxoacid:acceptor oxidoreductase family protein [Kiritimatiellia bacterium]MBU4247060.1 2-oxoacid:acceptor oxidoreductase family protein [Verrucomicrobiota bacterium]MBU4291134.1 2-oxoacid:acceptor oxidoreductase family protein [Verrucomicrobiota bacterium]MBU4428016.1 2-oxoacid:acceptor oxidoreductase family protein [Verrucomicrobiota bacterium]
MLERILIAGSGGQGILLIGKMLAQLAIGKVPYLTFFPSYGAEVRGGTSNCQVILSSHEIASPLAEEFDSLMIMNQQSAPRFLPGLSPTGLAVINQSLCRLAHDKRFIMIRATDIADHLGNARAANFVMLGAWLAHKPLIPVPDVEQWIAESFTGAKPAVIEANLKAFQAGLKHKS